jgi:hypothetical protein
MSCPTCPHIETMHVHAVTSVLPGTAACASKHASYHNVRCASIVTSRLQSHPPITSPQPSSALMPDSIDTYWQPLDFPAAPDGGVFGDDGSKGRDARRKHEVQCIYIHICVVCITYGFMYSFGGTRTRARSRLLQLRIRKLNFQPIHWAAEDASASFRIRWRVSALVRWPLEPMISCW